MYFQLPRKARAFLFFSFVILLPVNEIFCDEQDSVSTPNSTFILFRNSIQNQTWRKYFDCYDDAAKDELVYGAYLSCNVNDTPESSKLLKDHGVQPDNVWIEYCKLYKEKYKVDVPLLLARREKLNAAEGDKIGQRGVVDPNLASQQNRPPIDNTLRQIAVCNLVKDKTDFFEAVQNIVLAAKGGKPSSFGELEKLVIKDGTAIGFTKTIIPGPTLAGEKRANETKALYEVCFKKTEIGWKIVKVALVAKQFGTPTSPVGVKQLGKPPEQWGTPTKPEKETGTGPVSNSK